MMITM